PDTVRVHADETGIISRPIAFLYVFPRQRFEACPGLGDKRAIGVLGEEACIEIRAVGSACFVPGYRVRRPRTLEGIERRTRCEDSHQPQEPDEAPDRCTGIHSLPSLEKTPASAWSPGLTQTQNSQTWSPHDDMAPQPPPRALISSTAAVILLVRRSTAVRAAVNAALCAVTTSRYVVTPPL